MKDPKHLSSERYKALFEKDEGYFISSGTIASETVFHFLCNETNPENRDGFDEEIEPFDDAYWNAIVTIDRGNKKQPSSISRGWQGFTDVKIAVQENQGFGLDFYGQQLSFEPDGTGVVGENLSAFLPEEDVIDIYGAKVPNYAFSQIEDSFYIGIRGKIIKRIDAKNFEALLEFDNGNTGDERPRITHISGLSENNFYFVTDEQNVFHYDGQSVTEIDALSNFLEDETFHRHPIRDGSNSSFADALPEKREESITELKQISKSEVYVGTSLGRIFNLKNGIWIPLVVTAECPKIVYPIKNLVHCHKRTFFVCGFSDRDEIKERKSSMYLWEIINDTIVLADVATDVHRFAENLDAKNGSLLVCGKAGAIFWNGTDWEILIDEKVYEEATGYVPSEERIQEVALQELDYAGLADKLKSFGPFGEAIISEEEFPLKASMIVDPYPIAYAKNGADLSKFDVETVIYIEGDFEVDGTLVINFPLVVINGNLKVENLAVMRRLCVTGNVEVTNMLYSDEDPDGKFYGDTGNFSVLGTLSANNCLYVNFPIKVAEDFNSTRIVLCNDGNTKNTIFVKDISITEIPDFKNKIEEKELEDVVTDALIDENYNQESIIAALKRGEPILR